MVKVFINCTYILVFLILMIPYQLSILFLFFAVHTNTCIVQCTYITKNFIMCHSIIYIIIR